MFESNSLQALTQARRQVRALCEKDRYTAAMMYLSGAGCPPDTFPGLWEYLARRSAAGGEANVAHKVRQELWQSGNRSADVAFGEAQFFLQAGDHESARFVLETVFSTLPDNRRARHLLARCHLMQAQADSGRARIRTARNLALQINDGYCADTPEEAITIVDLLRFSGALDLATERNDAARAQFPHDPRFLLRSARILEQKRDPAGAIAIWEDVAETISASRTEALFKLHQLNTFLGHEAEATRAAARLMVSELSLPDRMRLAIATGQSGMIGALAKFTAEGGPADQPLDRAAEAAINDMLLDHGDIGLTVWLRRQRIAVSQSAKSVLEDSGFGLTGLRDLPDTFEEAHALRSPDFMLPLRDFLGKGARPAGWPGERGSVRRLLLVNGTLGGGGAERQFVELVRALVRSGVSPDEINCAFFSLEPERGFSRFLPDLQALRVGIHDLSTRPIVNAKLPDDASMVIEALPFELRQDVRALWHIVAELQPRAIHGWQDRAGLAASIVGDLADIERVIMSARNVSPASRGDRRLMGFKTLYQDFVAHQNYILTANAKSARDDYAHWLDCDPDQMPLLQNTVDTSRFNLGVRPDKPADSGPLRIGGIFRLAANKRPLLWLETVAALRRDHGIDLQPVLRGTGPMAQEVRDAANNLGLSDLRIDTEVTEPADIYADLDLVLLMSRVEGVPNILLEAQACGIAVAACDVGGVAEAMPRGGRAQGLLLPSDPDADQAAGLVADWLPEAATQPPKVRFAFVEREFGDAAMARAATELYLGRPVR